jgi:hypothetical protein
MYTNPQNTVIESITLDSTLGDSPVITFKGFRKIVCAIPAGSSITSLTYYVSPTSDGTFLQLYNSSGAVSTTVAAERAYQLTSELEGISYLKIVPNNDGNVSLHLIS